MVIHHNTTRAVLSPCRTVSSGHQRRNEKGLLASGGRREETTRREGSGAERWATAQSGGRVRAPARSFSEVL